MKIIKEELRKTRYVVAIIALVMLLAAYSIVELTRIIVILEFIQHIHTDEIPLWQFGLEIGLMWVLYLSIIPLLYWRLRR